MNRGDARLFLTIISAAIVSAVLTVCLTRALETPDPRIDEQTRRIANLELRIGELEARPATVIEQVPAPPPPPPTTVAVPAEAPPPPCDEVSCVLNNYEEACCKHFIKQPSHPSGAPDSLDRAMISAGINTVKARVMACGDASSAKGQVKIHARVDPDGTPHVSLKQAPDAALGECVVDAVAEARFAKTVYGGSFSYPFVF